MQISISELTFWAMQPVTHFALPTTDYYAVKVEAGDLVRPGKLSKPEILVAWSNVIDWRYPFNTCGYPSGYVG